MTPGTGTGFPSGCDLLCIVVFHQGPKRFLDAIPYVDLVSLRSGMANMSAVDTAIPHIYIYTQYVCKQLCAVLRVSGPYNIMQHIHAGSASIWWLEDLSKIAPNEVPNSTDVTDVHKELVVGGSSHIAGLLCSKVLFLVDLFSPSNTLMLK